MFGGRCSSFLAFMFALGCGEDCHDIGCGASLIVELAPEEQSFADGAYELTLESAQGSMVCGFQIADGSASVQPCAPHDASLDSAELPRFMLVRYYQEQPETLQVTLTRDGEELAASEVTPEYVQIIADSKACGGPCTSAQVSVAF